AIPACRRAQGQKGLDHIAVQAAARIFHIHDVRATATGERFSGKRQRIGHATFYAGCGVSRGAPVSIVAVSSLKTKFAAFGATVALLLLAGCIAVVALLRYPGRIGLENSVMAWL